MIIDAAAIIPTTGSRAAMLRRALVSVRDQHARPREVLVVVDGLAEVADAVRASIASIAFEGVSVLCTGQRIGASAARNFGARAASACFLCFLDDDDRWKPTYLQRAFADGEAVDLILTGFEKHTARGVFPEKIPPSELRPACFVRTNPGIRGSNIVVRASVYQSVGGFDADFVSFNDVDLGARVFERGELRYRTVREPLVEYHAHDGERLSKRGSPDVIPGMQRFLARYERSMSGVDSAAFRERARRNWDVDPWRADLVLERMQDARGPGQVAPLLRALDERVLESLDHGDDAVDRALRDIDELCARRSSFGGSIVKRLRLAVISTDGSTALVSLLTSLRASLERSRWRPGDSSSDAVEVLVLENDSSPRLQHERQAAVEAAGADTISVHFVSTASAGGVLSTAHARAALFRAILDRGWQPSPSEPVWVLDDDMRFEQLVPSHERGFRRVHNSSLLHRMELLIAQHRGADALICGNSGAAPVPALGLLAPQLRDLREAPQRALWAPNEAREAMRSGGRYYGFGLEMHGADSPRAWRRAWWREDQAWLWSDVEARLRTGLPVTRPALAVQGEGVSCWGPFAPPRVAGGNTILLSSRALVAEWLGIARCGAIESRRADSVWCHRARAKGLALIQVSIPLLHDRAPRSVGTAASLVRDALSDALGVGLYRAVEQGRFGDRSRIRELALERANQAQESVLESVETLERSDTPLRAALTPTLREVLSQLAEESFDGIEC